MPINPAVRLIPVDHGVLSRDRGDYRLRTQPVIRNPLPTERPSECVISVAAATRQGATCWSYRNHPSHTDAPVYKFQTSREVKNNQDPVVPTCSRMMRNRSDKEHFWASCISRFSKVPIRDKFAAGIPQK